MSSGVPGLVAPVYHLQQPAGGPFSGVNLWGRLGRIGTVEARYPTNYELMRDVRIVMTSAYSSSEALETHAMLRGK